MSIGDLWRIKKIHLQLQAQVIQIYYRKSWRFACCDIALGLASLFFNPYRVCRKRGSVYGETPIQSFHRIAQFCNLSKDDIWLELGSGRGKGAFWISQFVSCKTIGIESSLLFVWIANAIRKIVRVKHLLFVCKDMAEADFSSASVVYLYGTCMQETEIALLTKKMETLRSKAKVITVSAPLDTNPLFVLKGSFPLSFPWGDTEAYLHERV